MSYFSGTPMETGMLSQPSTPQAISSHESSPPIVTPQDMGSRTQDTMDIEIDLVSQTVIPPAPPPPPKPMLPPSTTITATPSPVTGMSFFILKLSFFQKSFSFGFLTIFEFPAKK